MSTEIVNLTGEKNEGGMLFEFSDAASNVIATANYHVIYMSINPEDKDLHCNLAKSAFDILSQAVDSNHISPEKADTVTRVVFEGCDVSLYELGSS